MATVLKRILLNVRMTLKDLSAGRYHEAQLLAAANEGKNALVRLLRSVRKDYFHTNTSGTFSSTTVPNFTKITLPSDFAEMKSIEITTSGYEWIGFYPLERSDRRFWEAALVGGDFASGYGSFYYDILGNAQLVLSPGSDVALTYNLEYNKTLPDFATLADTVTAVPEEFIEYITTWTIVEAMRSGNDERLQSYLDKLGSQATTIQDAAGSREIFNPRFVKGYLEDEEY